jgi:hypothetical protein
MSDARRTFLQSLALFSLPLAVKADPPQTPPGQGGTPPGQEDKDDKDKDDNGNGGTANEFNGTWVVEVKPESVTGAGVTKPENFWLFLSIADGSVATEHDTYWNMKSPLVPNLMRAAASDGKGTWVRVKQTMYRAYLLKAVYDPNGNYLGLAKMWLDVDVDRSKGSLAGTLVVEAPNAAGPSGSVARLNAKVGGNKSFTEEAPK